MRLLLFLVVAPSFVRGLQAQVVETTHGVYREGDDPRWARPDYDDSGWAKSPADLLYQRPQSHILWERCRIDTRSLPASTPLLI
jgi:hypothetical protein